MPKRGRDYDTANASYRRKGPLIKRRKVQSTGSSSYSTVARTRGPMAKGEMKYFDAYATNKSIPSGTDWTGKEIDPTGNTLFFPVVGAAINERIGNRVWVQKIVVKGNLNWAAQTNQTTADALPYSRLVLVQDTQSNGTQMQGEDVFAPTAADDSLNVAAFQAIKNFGRFRVLKDKTFKCPQLPLSYDGTNMEQSGAVMPFKMSYKFRKPVLVKYNSTNAGSIADVVDNSFHLLGVSNNDTSVPCTAYYNVRTYYKE